jgi:hypothetical protein
MRSLGLKACSAFAPATFLSCSLLDLSTLADDGAGGSSASSTSGTESTTISASVGGDGGFAVMSSSESSSGTGEGGQSGLLTDCVLLLHMDEDAWIGEGAAKDSSGQANHGTARAGAFPVPGRFGNAASVQAGAHVVVPDSPSFQFESQVTYMAWVRPTSVAGDPGIISKRVGFQQQVAFTLFISRDPNTDAPQWFADIESTRFNDIVSPMQTSWYHVAVVYDGAKVAGRRSVLYVNGAARVEANGPTELAPNDVDLSIGILPGGGTAFDGLIDEIAVWRRALSPIEIARIAMQDSPIQ